LATVLSAARAATRLKQARVQEWTLRLVNTAVDGPAFKLQWLVTAQSPHGNGSVTLDRRGTVLTSQQG